MDAHDLSTLTPKQIEHFWSRVDKSAGPDACWPWIGRRDKDGYGLATIHRRSMRSHRVAHILANGPLPFGKPFVLHDCDCPPCCNPRCLRAGTHADNMADRNAKGRQARGERHSVRMLEVAARGDGVAARLRPEQVSRGERHAARMRQVAARGDRNGSRLHPERRPRGDRNGSRLYPERLARGERNVHARLTEGDVLDIRASLAKGESRAAIARRLGVSWPTVDRVAAGKTWVHVVDDAAVAS